MVFCCDDEILHSGFPRHFRPCFGIEQIRIEMIEILLVIFIRDLLMVTDPFMPCGHGVESPVNKHSESVSDEPRGVALSEFSHDSLLFFDLVCAVSAHVEEYI